MKWQDRRKKSHRVWVRLPKSVVDARAGLIPSKETDGLLPPDCLTAAQLLAWHRGLPVLADRRKLTGRNKNRP